MENLARNLAAVHARMEDAARRAGRDPAAIRLLAVSKMQPAELLEQAWEAGQREFGENYLQEALPKLASLAFAPVLFRGWLYFIRNPGPLLVRKLGWSELGHAVRFCVLFIAAFAWTR